MVVSARFIPFDSLIDPAQAYIGHAVSFRDLQSARLPDFSSANTVPSAATEPLTLRTVDVTLSKSWTEHGCEALPAFCLCLVLASDLAFGWSKLLQPGEVQ